MPNIRMLSSRRELYEKEKMKQQGIIKARRNQENDTQDVAKKTNTSEAARTAKKAERDAKLAKAEEDMANQKRKTAAVGAVIGGLGALAAMGLTIAKLSTESKSEKKPSSTSSTSQPKSNSSTSSTSQPKSSSTSNDKDKKPKTPEEKKKRDEKIDGISKLIKQVLALTANVQISEGDKFKSKEGGLGAMADKVNQVGEGFKKGFEDQKNGTTVNLTQQRNLLKNVKDKQENKNAINRIEKTNYKDLSADDKRKAAELGITFDKNGNAEKSSVDRANKKNELTKEERKAGQDAGVISKDGKNTVNSQALAGKIDQLNNDIANGKDSQQAAYLRMANADPLLQKAAKGEELSPMEQQQLRGMGVKVDKDGKVDKESLDKAIDRGAKTTDRAIDTSETDSAIDAVSGKIDELNGNEELFKKASDPNQTLTEDEKKQLKSLGVEFDKNGNVDKASLKAKRDENTNNLRVANNSLANLSSFKENMVKESKESYGGLFRGGQNKFLMKLTGTSEDEALKFAQPNEKKSLKKFIKDNNIDKDDATMLNNAMSGSLGKQVAETQLKKLGLSDDQIKKYFKVDDKGNVTLKNDGLMGLGKTSLLAQDISNGKLTISDGKGGTRAANATDVAKLLDNMNKNGMSGLAGKVLGDMQKFETDIKKQVAKGNMTQSQADNILSKGITVDKVLAANNEPEKEYSNDVKNNVMTGDKIDITKLNALKQSDPVLYDKVLKELKLDDATVEANFNNKVGRIDEGLLNKVTTKGKFDQAKFDALPQAEKDLLNKVMVKSTNGTVSINQTEFAKLSPADQLKVSKSAFVAANTNNGAFDQAKFDALKTPEDKKAFLNAFVTDENGNFNQEKFNLLPKDQQKQLMTNLEMKDFKDADVVTNKNTQDFKNIKVLSADDKKFIDDLMARGVIKEDGTINETKLLTNDEVNRLKTITGTDPSEKDLTKMNPSLKNIVNKNYMTKETSDLVNSVTNTDGSFNQAKFDALSPEKQKEVRSALGVDNGNNTAITDINDNNSVRKEISNIVNKDSGKVDLAKLNELRKRDPVLYDKVVNQLGFSNMTVESKFNERVKESSFQAAISKDPQLKGLIDKVTTSDGKFNAAEFNKLSPQDKQKVMAAIGMKDIENTADRYNRINSILTNTSNQNLMASVMDNGKFSQDKFNELMRTDPAKAKQVLKLAGLDENTTDVSEIGLAVNNTMANVTQIQAMKPEDRKVFDDVMKTGKFDETAFNALEPEDQKKVLGIVGLNSDTSTALNISGENSRKIIDDGELNQMLINSDVDLKTSRNIINSSNRFGKDELDKQVGGAKEHKGEKANWFNMMVMGLNASMPAIQFMLQQLDKMREAEDQLNEARKKRQAALQLFADVAKELKRTQSAINGNVEGKP